MTLHIINNWARFIGDIRPASKQLYTGSGMENIKGFRTAKVTVITPLGKQKIYLINTVYILGFHTNLVCNYRLNEKGIFWHNKGNYLYYYGGKKFAYCGYYHGQITLKYNKLKLTTENVSFVA